MNIGLLAALAAMVFWGLGDFFIQKTVKKVGDIESLFFIGLFGAVVLFPFVANDLQTIFSTQEITQTLLTFGIITLVVALVNFQAYKVGKISVVEPILEFELPITIILSLLILKEGISSQQIFLSLSLFAGIALISLKKFSLLSRKTLLEKGVVLACATAVGMAFVNFYTAVAARSVSPLLAIWSSWVIFGGACGIYLFFTKGLSGIFKDMKNYKQIIFAEGFFDTIAWTLFAVALVNMPLGLATAISESYPVIGVLLGIFINKEKILSHQMLGVGLTLASAFFLGLTIL